MLSALKQLILARESTRLADDADDGCCVVCERGRDVAADVVLASAVVAVDVFCSLLLLVSSVTSWMVNVCF